MRDELGGLQSDQGVAANLYRKVHHQRQPRDKAKSYFFEVLQPLMNKVQSMQEQLEQLPEALESYARADEHLHSLVQVELVQVEPKPTFAPQNKPKKLKLQRGVSDSDEESDSDDEGCRALC